MKQKPIEVVAAILRLPNGKVLVGKRRKTDTNAGKWEFPGGKVIAGETDDQALRREIMEELEIEISNFSLFDEVSHDYPTYSVRIKFYLVDVGQGISPKKFSHDELQWIDPRQNTTLDFLEANEAVLQKLTILM